MTIIPTFLLNKVYRPGSLRLFEVPGRSHLEPAFDLVNQIAPGTMTHFEGVELIHETHAIAPQCFTGDQIELYWVTPEGSKLFQAHTVTETSPIFATVGHKLTCVMLGGKLVEGPYQILLSVTVKETGPLKLTLKDVVHSI